MIEQLFPNIDKIQLLEIWPNYIEDENKIYKLTKTNIRHANIALNSILTTEEKGYLEKAFFDRTGWYKKINGDGMARLKLAAMSLGLTNTVFAYDKMKEKEILALIAQYTINDQLMAMRCYAKQKAVTYVTLKNYLKDIKMADSMFIELYRGIKGEYKGEKYLHNGLECWTTSLDIAERFTGGDGYVIKKRYSIEQIFAGNRSTFKNRPYNMYRHNGYYVRREHEMIVENISIQYECKNCVYKHIDGDFF